MFACCHEACPAAKMIPTLSAKNTAAGAWAETLATKYAEALVTKLHGDPHTVALPAAARPPCKSQLVQVGGGRAGSVLVKHWTEPEEKIRSVDWPLLRFRLPEPHEPAVSADTFFSVCACVLLLLSLARC